MEVTREEEELRLLPGILAEANGSPLPRSKSWDARRHSDPRGAGTLGGDPSFEEGKLAMKSIRLPAAWLSLPGRAEMCLKSNT